jgi:hypothetical protein
VFSNASDFAEIKFIEQIAKNLEFENIIFSDKRKNILDMYLMAACRYHIVANSSFSWWGAYLSELFEDMHKFLDYGNNYEKICVAPSKWFTDEFCNTFHGGVSPEICTPVLNSWVKVHV